MFNQIVLVYLHSTDQRLFVEIKRTAWLVFDIPKTPTAQKHIDSRKQHQLGLNGYVHVIKVMN